MRRRVLNLLGAKVQKFNTIYQALEGKNRVTYDKNQSQPTQWGRRPATEEALGAQKSWNCGCGAPTNRLKQVRRSKRKYQNADWYRGTRLVEVKEEHLSKRRPERLVSIGKREGSVQ